MMIDLFSDPTIARRVVGLFTMANHRLELINRRYPDYSPVKNESQQVFAEDEPEDPIQSLAYDPSRYPHFIELETAHG